MTEGYIKFNCNWEQKEILIPEKQFGELNKVRSQLYNLGLIGVYPDGIGFGNISVRENEGNSFIITGSATGQFAELHPNHYARVTGYNFENNSLSCIGQTKASAESLSHAAVYKSLPEIGAVVHVHCLWLWEKLLNIYPTTPIEIEYGTPEMAGAISKLVSGMKNVEKNVLIMGGHREGILAFGRNPEEATGGILKLYYLYKHD